MQIVILAGGLGTRLKELTEKTPKAMISVHGKPFIDFQVRHLLSQGFGKILMITGHLSSQIEAYVQKQSWSSRVQFLIEGDELRGTGGALQLAREKNTLEDKFLLLYGDSFLPIDFQNIAKIYQNSNLTALMTVLKNKGAWDQSNVIFEFNKLQLYDKTLNPKPAQMNYIDYGLLGLRASLFDYNNLKEVLGGVSQKWDLSMALTDLSKKGQLLGVEVNERFYEIGSFQGLEDFEKLVSESPWREFFDKTGSAV